MPNPISEGNIRADLLRNLENRVPGKPTRSLIESIASHRSDTVNQPFARAITTEVRNLKEFYALFQKVLNVAREYDGLEESIQLAQSYQPTEAELPCFTTHLISRDPYEAKGRAELAPKFMEEVEDPDNPGNVITRSLMRQTNKISMTVWARSNKTADDLAEWIEDKFFEFLWVIQWAGLFHPVWYLGRTEDSTMDLNENIIHGRTLHFLVITGKITERRHTILRKLVTKIGIE